MPDPEEILRAARHVVVQVFPTRAIPDALTRAGFTVTIYGGPAEARESRRYQLPIDQDRLPEVVERHRRRRAKKQEICTRRASSATCETESFRGSVPAGGG